MKQVVYEYNTIEVERMYTVDIPEDVKPKRHAQWIKANAEELSEAADKSGVMFRTRDGAEIGDLDRETMGSLETISDSEDDNYEEVILGDKTDDE